MKIIKGIKYKTEEGKQGKCALHIILANSTMQIEHLTGIYPYWNDLKLFLLADKDIRQLILQYQQSTTPYRFKITDSKAPHGGITYFRNVYTQSGIFIKREIILYLSCAGKIKDDVAMSIGDFVELLAYEFALEKIELPLSSTKEHENSMSNKCGYCSLRLEEKTKCYPSTLIDDFSAEEAEAYQFPEFDGCTHVIHD